MFFWRILWTQQTVLGQGPPKPPAVSPPSGLPSESQASKYSILHHLPWVAQVRWKLIDPKKCPELNTDFLDMKHMDVSKNRGTPKWMVYNGKPYENGWFGGTIIFGNIHIETSMIIHKNTSIHIITFNFQRNCKPSHPLQRLHQNQLGGPLIKTLGGHNKTKALSWH